jgi:hypothetical protein
VLSSPTFAVEGVFLVLVGPSASVKSSFRGVSRFCYGAVGSNA